MITVVELGWLWWDSHPEKFRYLVILQLPRSVVTGLKLTSKTLLCSKQFIQHQLDEDWLVLLIMGFVSWFLLFYALFIYSYLHSVDYSLQIK